MTPFGDSANPPAPLDDSSRATHADVRPGGPTRPPNLLFIVLDCARAKSFAANGGDRTARTPVIDRLARDGTVFPGAVAPANWTVPSHMSMFTGDYPGTHGRRTFERGPAPRETTASWLARRGYETAMFTEMVHLVGGYGLEDGYAQRVARHIGISDEERTTSNWIASHSEALYSPWMRRLLERVPPFIVPLNFVNHPQEVAFKREVCNSFVPDAFRTWVDQRDADRPFHAFVNLVDAHEPYPLVPNGHRIGAMSRWYARTPRYYLLAVPGLQARVPWEELLRGYLWSIEQADRKVGAMVEALERAGERDRTLIVVTADHGQSFGEGGNVFHGCGATDSIARVPLVVSGPAEFSLPHRVDRWTSLCELPSWFKAAASGRAPFDETGTAPMPFGAPVPSTDAVFCEGAPASDPNRSLRGIRADAPWNHRLLAAYRGEEKLVLDLETSDVFRWTMTGSDPDLRPPEPCSPGESRALRAEVFEPYRGIESVGRGGPSLDQALAPEIDARLRSWGYD
ncbi:MAG: sulfatase-like hydrolase/transferase [Thermoplasmata archaeon]|nr:sulfatase-like hydrolase/transferase [Thermoplasmata archaeon]